MKASYDTPWKIVLEQCFKHLIEFLFPQVATDIDWTKPPQFLDKELSVIQSKSNVGNQIADKLVQVYKHNGNEAWVLIHVEIQGQKEDHFPQRMFEYFYRIYDKYKKSVMSLAILTDTNKNWRPEEYYHELWGCKLSLIFPIVKLIDFKSQEARLNNDANPIAKIIQAHLIALSTRNDPMLRFENKLQLVKNLYQLDYTADYLRVLYMFIEKTMILPRELENRFIDHIKQHEEENNMQYVLNIERFAKEEGMQVGARKILRSLLEHKFGNLNEYYLKRLESVNSDELEGIVSTIMKATRLEEIFSIKEMA